MSGQINVINTIDTAHEAMIHDAQMDYFGKRLATCSSDKTVKIFEVSGDHQTLVDTLYGHDGPVWQVAWAHPKFGSILASCSYDRKVIIWKEVNGAWKQLYEFCEHKSSVNSIKWAPHEWGLILACGSSDESISILTTSGDGSWKYSKIDKAHNMGCNAVSWAPAIAPGSLVEGSGKAPFIPNKRLASGGGDRQVKIWKEEKEESWHEEAKLDLHTDWVRDIAWAPSIGLPQNRIASCSQDCKVVVWTKDDSSSEWQSVVLNTFNDVIWHVSWSITGDILAVSGGDNKVTLWKQVPDGQWTCVGDIDKSQK